jgi:hypothetical protein
VGRGDGSYGLELSDTPRPVVADLVVLALPFTRLRRVDLTRAGVSEKRREAIRALGMGTNAKDHFQLSVRPYRLANWSGSMAMDEPFRQSSWESTAGQRGPTSVITIYRGGRSGASYPTDVPHQPARSPSSRRTCGRSSAAFRASPTPTTDARGSTRGSTIRGRAAPTPRSCRASTRNTGDTCEGRREAFTSPASTPRRTARGV